MLLLTCLRELSNFFSKNYKNQISINNITKTNCDRLVFISYEYLWGFFPIYLISLILDYNVGFIPSYILYICLSFNAPSVFLKTMTLTRKAKEH